MNSVKNICKNFINGNVLEITRAGGGHINDTFVVKTDNGVFVCQHMGEETDIIKLEHNYRLCFPALKNSGLIFPEWIKRKDCDEYFYTDINGEHWRMYPYIEGDIPGSDKELTPEVLFSCGYGLAKMHAALQNISEKPEAVYPGLHDLRHYYDGYTKLIPEYKRRCNDRDSKPGTVNKTDTVRRDPALEEKINSGIKRFLKHEPDRSSVVHGDAKLSNMLLTDGHVTAFIDMDTVMHGSVLEDIADCIRSACAGAGRIDRRYYDAILNGYLNEGSMTFSSEMLHLLPETVCRICFELALRYYTDSISGQKYFRETYPGQSLAKAIRYMNMSEEFTV